MTTATDAGVPPGYRAIGTVGVFISGNGDMYWRPEPDGQVSFGTRIEDRHCNIAGSCHGGWIATYCDMALPLTARFTIPEFEERVLLTVSLTVDYLDPARSGDWLEGRATVLRRTARMVFVQGLLSVGERLVARSSTILRIGPQTSPAR